LQENNKREAGYPGGCQGKIDKVNPRLLKLMRDSGCVKISYGVESGSPRIQRLMRKNLPVDLVPKVIKWTREAGIHAAMYLMIGYPGETERDIMMTWELVKKSKPNMIYIFITIPLPGSELFDRYHGHLKTNFKDVLDWEKYLHLFDASSIINDTLDIQRLLNLQKLIYTRFYFSWHYFKLMLKI